MIWAGISSTAFDPTLAVSPSPTIFTSLILPSLTVKVTDVDVSNDHSYATVYVTFLGKKERNEKGIKTLNKAKGYIRSELSKRLKTRRVPEINFKLDESYEKARKLDAILQQINSEKKEEE